MHTFFIYESIVPLQGFAGTKDKKNIWLTTTTYLKMLS